MERATKALRAAVLAEWVLIASSAFVAIAFESSLPAALREFLADQDAGVSDAEGVAYILLLACYLGASIGVYRLWRPARVLYTVGVLGGTVLSYWLGHTVTPAWVSPTEHAASLCSGLVLGLLWFSPAGAHFSHGPTPPAAQQGAGPS